MKHTINGDIKVIHYYLKTDGDSEGKHKIPKTAVTLIIDEKGYAARGLAICNPSDNFCKKTGRDLSANRALGSFKSGKSFYKIRHTDLFVEKEMKYKAECSPALTSFEKGLIKKPV